jgi:hypothetical protein
MITQLMLEANKRGIYCIKVFVGTVNSTMIILATECSTIKLDEESGGVWYQLKAKNAPLPVNETLIYTPPSGLVQIAFNEEKKEE